jgi:hypothetical protein
MFCGAFCSWVLRKVRLDGVNVVKAMESKRKGDNKVEVVRFSQEMQEIALLPKVMNPTEASGPTRVSEVFKLSSIYINRALNGGFFLGFIYFVINCFWCIGWDIYKPRFWLFCGAFCSWVLREVELDGVNVVKAKESKEKEDNKVEVVIFSEEMEVIALLPKVINATEASGPTRVLEVFKLSSIYVY